MSADSAHEAALAVRHHTRTHAVRHRESLEDDHWGSSALMCDGEVIEVFADGSEACDAGMERFGQGNFGIMHIGIASTGYLTVPPTD